MTVGTEAFQLCPAFAAEFLSFRILYLAFQTFHIQCPLWNEVLVRKRKKANAGVETVWIFCCEINEGIELFDLICFLNETAEMSRSIYMPLRHADA
jgi:hypothetical protein